MGDLFDLNLPFISCSVCHKIAKNRDLYLTSCAHILCRDHLNNLSHGSSVQRCQACGHENVTVVKLDQRLPQDIQPFLTPFPKQIEQFFAVAQFQYVGMMEKIQYQEVMIEKLVLKMNKQKQLLLLAKEKVTEVDNLELKIKQLERENSNWKAAAMCGDSNANDYSDLQKRTHLQQQRPSTIDLTMNDSFGSDLGGDRIQTSSRGKISESFLKQVKKNSSQKSSIHRPYVPPYTNANLERDFNRNELPDTSLEFAKSKIAESTNILGQSSSPLQTNVPLGNKLHPLMNTIGSSNSTYSNSSGSKSGAMPTISPNTSFTSSNFQNPYVDQHQDKPKIVPLYQKKGQPVPQSGGTRFSSNNGNRTTKKRASTSQIAQRLSAHMKIGSLQRTKSSNGTDGTGLSLRPGSSFSNTRFRR